jgi:hypothetical protein
LALPVVASATEEFVCVTGPSSPGLSTRTTMFTFVGDFCVDVALASLVCFVGALCSADWVWPEPELPVAGAACDWELVWFVVFALPAELVAALVLLCSAAAWLPLPTLTGACVEVALLAAFWSVGADWTTVCD